jgi:hypothetical protein
VRHADESEQLVQLRHFQIMDALADDGESRAERIARYWKKAAMAFDRSSTAPVDRMRAHYVLMARMWVELAEELERNPRPIVHDGDAQSKRH